MVHTNWKRLIRFVAVEDGKTYVGEPADAEADIGVASAPKAYILNSSTALDLEARPTREIRTVKRLLAPLASEEVGTVRFLGLNYRDHAEECKLAIPKQPILFYKPTTALGDPFSPIIIPRVAQPAKENQSDYEAELVVVIGRPARDVSESEALDYVLGYTAGNDVSFRTHQFAGGQWGFSKSFDGSAPWGPALVSVNVIRDPQNLPIGIEVNGEKLQDGTTKDQIFGLAKTIAFLSQGTTLLPGSLIWTGTPAGVGFARNPPVYLKHGDETRVVIGGGIGTLVNPVIEEGKAGRSRL